MLSELSEIHNLPYFWNKKWISHKNGGQEYCITKGTRPALGIFLFNSGVGESLIKIASNGKEEIIHLAKEKVNFLAISGHC